MTLRYRRQIDLVCGVEVIDRIGAAGVDTVFAVAFTVLLLLVPAWVERQAGEIYGVLAGTPNDACSHCCWCCRPKVTDWAPPPRTMVLIVGVLAVEIDRHIRAGYDHGIAVVVGVALPVGSAEYSK